jgi:hypothetical protein
MPRTQATGAATSAKEACDGLDVVQVCMHVCVSLPRSQGDEASHQNPYGIVG